MCMKNTKAGGIKTWILPVKENEIIHIMYLSPFIATKMGWRGSGVIYFFFFWRGGKWSGIGNEGQCRPFRGGEFKQSPDCRLKVSHAMVQGRTFQAEGMASYLKVNQVRRVEMFGMAGGKRVNGYEIRLEWVARMRQRTFRTFSV